MSAQPAGGERFDYLADWLRKARLAASLPPGEPWPAWSTGELLAVAVILHDTEMLADLDYTRDEAIERLRFDIGASFAEAAAAFERLRTQLTEETPVGTICIDDMFARILDELHHARNHLSEAASWARSDWAERRGLTPAESAAKAAVFDVVGRCKDAIDQAKGLIVRIDDDRSRS